MQSPPSSPPFERRAASAERSRIDAAAPHPAPEGPGASAGLTDSDPAERARGLRSLRTELLFNLGFLAGSALLLLAVWTTALLRFGPPDTPRFLFGLALLVAADVLVFVLLADHLLRRLVLRPLAEAADAMGAIAAGDLDRRVPRAETREVAALGTSFNTLTDQLFADRALLVENVRSLDRTNQRLVEAQRELTQSEKLAAIGRLAAGVAHEVGNPLGAVLGYVGLLRRRGAPADLVDGVQTEARRIDRIVRGLLAYARAGAAAAEPAEPIDVAARIRSALERVGMAGGTDGIQLRWQLPADLPPVRAIGDPLEQVFVNLFQNARAAMLATGGGGVLGVRAVLERYLAQPVRARRADDPPEIDYSHLRRDASGQSVHGGRLVGGECVIRIEVSDTGAGIEAAHLSSVWDPFFTTKPPGEGTGLGLAIVASTVAELGGEIRVRSAPGEGSTFTLFLPTEAERCEPLTEAR